MRSRARPSKEARRTKLKRKVQVFAGLAIFFVLALMGGFFWLINQPSVAFSRTLIVGEEKVSFEAVQQLVDEKVHAAGVGWIPKDNRLFFSRINLQRDIKEAFPRVRSAQVAVVGLSEPVLSVRIAEREPFARWCDDTRCFILDKKGYIFAPHDRERTALPVEFLGGLPQGDPVGRTYGGGFFTHLAKVTEVLSERDLQVARLRIENDTDMTLHFSRGFAVHAPIRMHPDVLLETLELTRASEPIRKSTQQLLYIDMRFDNRVYYKFKEDASEDVAHEDGAQ